MPDPKLKLVAEEIRAILVKHDVAAIVILASPTHLEYLHHVNPSWSGATFEGHELRVKVKRADFATTEEHKKVLVDTVGLFVGFYDAARTTTDQMAGVVAMIGKHVPFEHMTKHE